MNVALFCVFRNEHIYIKEFVDHYLKLGFNHIYLCDNSDNDKLNNIIKDYGDLISMVDIRSSDQMHNFSNYQIKLYTSLYNIYSFKYDWVCFFDIDEFLILHSDNTIQDYLSRNIFDNVDQIHVNWKVFDDNNQLRYENKPMIKRFSHVSNIYYDRYKEYANGVKSILRSNLNLKFLTMHTAISNTENQLITTDNDGNYYDESYSSHDAAYYELAQLNHYVTKSTEEYLNKNMSILTKDKQEFINRYFHFNKYSKKKYNILKTILD